MSSEKTPPAKKPDGVSTHCVVCGHHLNRGCACPWQKPFEEWLARLLSKVGDIVDGGPRPGS